MENEISITSFSGEYYWLSNFSPAGMTHEGIVYDSVENVYQAYKTEDMKLRLEISQMSPGQAKRAGKKLKLREDWEQVKLEGMALFLAYKFRLRLDSPLLWQLAATKGKELIEGNTWGDKFWGAVWDSESWNGKNFLGVLLMKRRAENFPLLADYPTWESYKKENDNQENYWRDK